MAPWPEQLLMYFNFIRPTHSGQSKGKVGGRTAILPAGEKIIWFCVFSRAEYTSAP